MSGDFPDIKTLNAQHFIYVISCIATIIFCGVYPDERRVTLFSCRNSIEHSLKACQEEPITNQQTIMTEQNINCTSRVDSYQLAASLIRLTFATMKKVLVFSLLIVSLLTACNNNQEKAAASENDMDAARNFIQAALDGRWSDAKKFMLQDSVNVEALETVERSYQTKTTEDKRGYRESSINFYNSRKVNDSITIVNYSNSYMNKKDSLKVVRMSGQWLIDLKYSLLPGDTTRYAH